MKRHLSLLLTGLVTGLLGCSHEEFKVNGANPFTDEEKLYDTEYGAESFEELNLRPTRILSVDEKQQLANHIHLKKLEYDLKDPRQREQYFDYGTYLKTEGERIDFLSLPTMDARDRYAVQKGFYFYKNKFSPDIKEAIAHSDIIVGMNKDAVVNSWGEPKEVEVAGGETYGNERWRYDEYVSSSGGFQQERHYVYFENGRVVGWKKD